MAHEIHENDMAYAGQTPWHGLGHKMQPDASLDEWIKTAGFDWEIEVSPVQYLHNETMIKFDNRQVLHRSDTGAPLSVMTDRYKVVQPATVMEFFRDLCEDQNLTMETAGMLKGGATYWALAATGQATEIKSHLHKAYLLLSTSCDGTQATDTRLTDVCVVCNNTLSMAMFRKPGESERVKTKHSTEFDPDRIKAQLGLIDLQESWDQFTQTMIELEQLKIAPEQARQFYTNLLRPESNVIKLVSNDDDKPERAIRGLDDIMKGYLEAPGADAGTAYGLVQGITHYVDHERGKDQTKRLQSAFLGQGDKLKRQAFEAATTMLKAA